MNIKIKVTDEMVDTAVHEWEMTYSRNQDNEREAMRYVLSRAVLDIVERDLNTPKSDGVLNCSEHDMGDCPYHRGPSREVWSEGCIEVEE